MKSIVTTVIATLFISLPVTVFAEGGSRWEKNAEKREIAHKMSMDDHMNHANSGHGSMMKESSDMKNPHTKGCDNSHSKQAKKMKPEHKGKDTK
jgi:hypothetical protein